MYLLFLGCASACWVQVAAAAEVKVIPVAPTQQNADWQGFYLRGNGGFSADGSSWTSPAATNGFSPPGTPTTPANESFGYNFQSGNFVLGLEGSFAAANFDGRFTSPAVPVVGGWTPNMNWMGTVTGRVGYAFDRWLPYVKGGFASADVGSPLQDGTVSGFTQSSQQTGWTAGVGLEYQLSSKWSLGLEYLYTDLGNTSGTPEMYTAAPKTQSVLGRLNYKGGW